MSITILIDIIFIQIINKSEMSSTNDEGDSFDGFCIGQSFSSKTEDSSLQIILEAAKTKIHKYRICLIVIALVLVCFFILPMMKRGFVGVDGLCLSRPLMFLNVTDRIKIYSSDYQKVSILIHQKEKIQQVYEQAKVIFDSLNIQKGNRIYYGLKNQFLLSLLSQAVGNEGKVYIRDNKDQKTVLLMRNIQINNLRSPIQLTTSNIIELYPLNFIIQEGFESMSSQFDKDTIRIQSISSPKTLKMDKNLQINRLTKNSLCFLSPSTSLVKLKQNEQIPIGVYKVINTSSLVLPWKSKPINELSCITSPRQIVSLSLRFSAEQTIYDSITLVRRRKNMEEPTLLQSPYQFQGILSYIRGTFDVNSIYFNHDNPYLFTLASGLLLAAKKRSSKIFIDLEYSSDVEVIRKNIDFAGINKNVVIGPKSIILDIYQPLIGLAVLNHVKPLKMKNNLKGMKKTYFLLTLQEQETLPIDKNFEYEVLQFEKNSDCTMKADPLLIKSAKLLPGNYLIKRKFIQSEYAFDNDEDSQEDSD